MELIRRIDSDYVNISSIITYAKYLSQTAPTSRSRSQITAPNVRPPLPPAPTADELPPNHIFISSGARVINGGWVPLSTARALVKNYHDLPPFIRRVFLSDSLAEKFPPPIPYVRNMLVGCREKLHGPVPAFGKPFAKPQSLSAHELLVSSGGVGPGVGASGVLASTTVITDVKGPVTASRGGPLSLNMSAAGFLPTSYPLSPVAALSSANALRAKAAQHSSANSMQSLMALSANPLSSSLNGWSLGFTKAPVERTETPLEPEEEAMLNAILKTPPKAQTDVKSVAKGSQEGEEEEGEGMNVDEEEEEEVAREVVDIGSEEETKQIDKVEDTVKPGKRSVPPKRKPAVVASMPSTAPTSAPAPRRSLRRIRSISSISSELTVSESESSASPPSLDSRPVPKGKSSKESAAPALAALTAVNGRRKRGNAAAAAVITGTASVPLPARLGPDSTKKVKIVHVDEPTEIGKPRRSIRTAKTEPAPAPAPVPSATGPTPRASKANQAAADAKSSGGGGGGEKAAAVQPKPRRSTAVEKEVERDGPVLTRAGAAAAQRNAKRTLRSRA